MERLGDEWRNVVIVKAGMIDKVIGVMNLGSPRSLNCTTLSLYESVVRIAARQTSETLNKNVNVCRHDADKNTIALKEQRVHCLRSTHVQRTAIRLLTAPFAFESVLRSFCR